MTEKRNKRKEFIHIGRVLPSVLKTFRSDADTNLIAVWDLWNQAVGPVIAENTRPAAFKGTLLLVYASSSPWIHQLQFLKEEIIRNINQALGEDLIEEMRFKIGPI